MKKTIKKTAAVISAISLLAGVTGCKKENNVTNGETTELSIFMHFWGYNVYNDEWPIFKEAEKLTGVHLKGTAVETVSDSGQAFNTMIASNRLPDIIHYEKKDLNKIGMEGALIPLEDLIEKYAPNIKKLFEDYPYVKRFATASDGHIYFIPGSTSGVEDKALPSTGWFIRKDWLNKLGLSEPKTVDEFYNVLKAFKEQDPNGNGKSDEIPYFSRQSGVGALYQLFDAHTGWYEEDGKVICGFASEEYRDAVKEIAKWYKEGLIDSEIYTRGNQTREQLLSADIGGATHDWFSSTAAYNLAYKDTIEGFDFEPIAPPADIKGVVKENDSRASLHALGWGISKDNQNIEATIKYFDFWMSEEGRRLYSYGVEGEDYTKENGEIKFTDAVLNYEKGVPTYLRQRGQVEMGSIGSIEAELSGMSEIAISGFNLYKDNKWCKPEFTTEYTPEENEILKAYTTDINTYVKEMELKWITGYNDVMSDWDSYISQLEKMHLSDIAPIYQSGWERANK